MKLINNKYIPFLVLNVAIGISLIFMTAYSQREEPNNKISRDQIEGFLYTSPILDCESVQGLGLPTISYKDIHQEVIRLSKKYDTIEFSVYFRELNNGQWIGVNEKAFFSPASLMKIPLLIGFLKIAEKYPEILDTKVLATEEYFQSPVQQNFKSHIGIEKGRTYTLKQVLEIMVQNSDNTAALMLSKYIRPDDLRNLFKSIGVPIDKKFQEIDIRVKDFATFFRVLYNASYLNREMSELALSILEGSSFKGGIAAGVPKDISVANKYGERVLVKGQIKTTVEKQLHDCGIVYLKNSPYILCIMTQGTDFKKQQDFIADVSRFIYKKIDEM